MKIRTLCLLALVAGFANYFIAAAVGSACHSDGGFLLALCSLSLAPALLGALCGYFHPTRTRTTSAIWLSVLCNVGSLGACMYMLGWMSFYLIYIAPLLFTLVLGGGVLAAILCASISQVRGHGRLLQQELEPLLPRAQARARAD